MKIFNTIISFVKNVVGKIFGTVATAATAEGPSVETTETKKVSIVDIGNTAAKLFEKGAKLLLTAKAFATSVRLIGFAFRDTRRSAENTASADESTSDRAISAMLTKLDRKRNSWFRVLTREEKIAVLRHEGLSTSKYVSSGVISRWSMLKKFV